MGYLNLLIVFLTMCNLSLAVETITNSEAPTSATESPDFAVCLRGFTEKDACSIDTTPGDPFPAIQHYDLTAVVCLEKCFCDDACDIECSAYGACDGVVMVAKCWKNGECNCGHTNTACGKIGAKRTSVAKLM